MESLTKVQSLSEKLNSIKEAGLSFNEIQLLKMLKIVVKKQEELLNNVKKAINGKRWSEVLGTALQLIQRCNMVMVYVMQPTIIGSINDPSLYESIDTLVETSTSCISELVTLLKHNSKDLGIESITMNLITNPLSVSVSITFK
ncbi:MAG: hypothetical protein JZD40_06625 [Sulfolobus sp.]|nr:hypothetical protein [Sulfolobus sp.]